MLGSFNIDQVVQLGCYKRSRRFIQNLTHVQEFYQYKLDSHEPHYICMNSIIHFFI